MTISSAHSCRPPSTPGSALAPAVAAWLDAHAAALDEGGAQGAIAGGQLLSRLAASGLFRTGVPLEQGGNGGPTSDAIRAVADVAAHSQAAAFVLWAQRVFIDYLLVSPNRALRAAWLPALLEGTVAGATGLSNAMKFLGGIESLQVRIASVGGGYAVDGVVPWATNLVPGNFIVAVAVEHAEAGRPAVLAMPANATGVQRSGDLDLIGLRGTHTASVYFERAASGPGWLLHEDAHDYLPRVRPAFLGMQCGLSLGLARASLLAARSREGAARSVLAEDIDDLDTRLRQASEALLAGVDHGSFLVAPRRLFALRIELVEIATQAVQLEVQARGGAGYLNGRHDGLPRRWREAAFLPIVTPSLVQLRTELARAGRNAA
ncbi:acyl-CoA dehydrogenase family protein [Cupriavidus gilardii]|uniref:acyl-CoA dehydrogenase family protein n=1 Tax=Cupriavidus gilardii TaxID=82541 RepID=UPI001572127B|nr:acyl-CoA dehydrogenase family protein [Cupriavidus gilardii]NSX03270.1 acyl-CoA/acyl-ACP dehydrogenase [Cupriavidus gilardii]